MKDRMRRVAIATALAAIALMPATAAAQGVGSALEVRQSLGELRSWLAGSGFGEGWDTYLQNNDLAAQLDLASDPAAQVDMNVLQMVLAKYSGTSNGLQMRRFVAVREALAGWISNLSQPGLDALADQARQAAGNFAGPDEASLAAAAARVNESGGRLQRFMAGGGTADGWRSYLNWDALQLTLAAPLPDVEVLQTAADQFESGYDGLQLPMFADYGAALRHYTQLQLIAQDPNAQGEYARRMGELANAIVSYQQSADAGAMQSVAEQINWLESRGLASDLTMQIRDRLWLPNLIFHVSPSLATAGFTESVNEVSDVTDVILGTSIQGKARTVGDVHARLVPAEGRAVFENIFVGTTYSNTMGYNRGIVINSDGTTKFTATKQFSFDEYGFTGFGSNAQAQTYSNTNWIDVGKKHPWIRGLVTRVAERKVHQSRPEADFIASRHAEDRIEEQMDLNADERLAQANRDYYEKFRKPLLDKGLFPQTFDARSSAAGLLFVMRQYEQGGIAATTSPPDLAASDDIVVSAHESAINATMSAMLAGRTVNRDEFIEEIGELLGEVPEQMVPPEDERSWTIKFAPVDPVTVRADGELVTLVIRGLSFYSEGDEPDNVPMNITVKYRFVQNPAGFQPGDVVARREDLTALPPDYQEGQVLPLAITGLARRLRTNFGKTFKEELIAESRPLPDRWAQAGDMWLHNVKTTPGWLVFGWKAAPSQVPDVPTAIVVEEE